MIMSRFTNRLYNLVTMKRRAGIGIPEIPFVIILFGISLIFRIWLTNLAPQPLGLYDQGEYEWYAHKMYDSPWLLASHTYRSYLYPLLLAVVYRIAGFGNREVVLYLQAAMDSIVSLFVYSVLAKGIKVGLWARIGSLLNAFNSITSGYVGVLLPIARIK